MRLATLLRMNALSCLAFGALFAAAPAAVAAFLGSAAADPVRLLGVLLMLHGAHLVWASGRRTPAWEVRYFSAGDALWVVVSLALIASGFWVTTAAGQAAVLAVAAGVGMLGWLQWRAVG